MERREQDVIESIKRTRRTHMLISTVPLGVLAYLLAVHVFPILQEQGADLLIFCMMAVLVLTVFLAILGYGVTRREAERVTVAVREARQALFHVLNACTEVAGAPDEQQVVDRMAAGARSAVRARAALVWIPGDGGLRVAGTAGARQQDVRVSLEAGRGMAGRAVQAGRPARNVTLSQADRLVDEALGIHTLHAIALPLTDPDGGVRGALTLHDRRDGGRFSKSDLDIAVAIGSVGALALARLGLHTQQHRTCSVLPALIGNMVDEAFLWSGHSATVARWSLAIAEELRLDEVFRERLGLAAHLHDIGLQHPVGRDPAAQEALFAHPNRGADIVKGMEPWRASADFIRTHHERMDGRGYPGESAEYNIPLGGRILALAEWWDEVTNPASPLRRFSEAEALEFLEKDDGKAFDPPIVRAFRDVMIRQEGA